MASGMWQGAGGIRRSCMRQQFVVVWRQTQQKSETGGRERGRERGRSERVIDKTGAELHTPGRESSSTRARGKRGLGGYTHFRCDATTSKSLF